MRDLGDHVCAAHSEGEMATLALATSARRAYVFTASHLSHLLYLLRKAVRRIVWAWPCAPGPGNNEVLHLRWLNKALTRVGLQGGGSQVVAADLVPLSENPWGMVGSIRRFRLTYNGVGTPGPASLVLKVGGRAPCACARVLRWALCVPQGCWPAVFPGPRVRCWVGPPQCPHRTACPRCCC